MHGLFSNQTDLKETDGYNVLTSSYWSAFQNAAVPHCVFKPSSAREVAIQVLLSRLTSCPFAAKSGGHAAFTGASNSDGGITVSLELLNEVSVSEDKSTVAIGPGNTWSTVYAKLEEEDVLVVGGRVSSVGVGGLLLGGGISFFSNMYGWACDNIIGYELVTADGTILQVTHDSHPDLFWALRGGGNNFGIVTRFTLAAFPHEGGLMWGGNRYYLETEFPSIDQAFYGLATTGIDNDPKAAQVLSYVHYNHTNLACLMLQYADPVENAPVFDDYLALPAIHDTFAVRTLKSNTDEVEGTIGRGQRQSFWVASYKLSLDMVNYIHTVGLEEAAAIGDVPGLIFSLPIQVINKQQIAAMSRNGGNALGLKTEDGPLVLLNLAVMWALEADDERVFKASEKILERLGEYAKSKGWEHDFMYMNYASKWQDVVASYGQENKDKLVEIANKYDPSGVFQKLEPGHFKLHGAPVAK